MWGDMATDTMLAAMPALGGIAIGFAVGYFIFKLTIEKWYGEKRKFSTVAKFNYQLGRIACITVMLGFGQIANELLFVIFNESQIRSHKIELGLFTVLAFPILAVLVGVVRNLFANKENTFEDTKNHVDIKSQSKTDDIFWEKAITEFEENRRKGLYARLFAENNGDENKIKSQYIKIRKEEIANELSLVNYYTENTTKSNLLDNNKSDDKEIKATEVLGLAWLFLWRIWVISFLGNLLLQSIFILLDFEYLEIIKFLTPLKIFIFCLLLISITRFDMKIMPKMAYGCNINWKTSIPKGCLILILWGLSLLFVAFNFDTDTWVNYKLFAGIIFFVLFLFYLVYDAINNKIENLQFN